MSTAPHSGRFARAFRIAGYSRRAYVAAGVVVAGGTVAAFAADVPWLLRWCGGLAAAVAGWYAGASFLAFHWMFDRSDLLRGRWLLDVPPGPPARCVQFHAGLEETTLPLGDLFPAAETRAVDLYHPTVLTEPAVGRARSAAPVAEAIRPDALPLADGWADLAVVMLVAHEIRDPGTRERFFRELRRIVAPSGRVAVVEHLRDASAALAFGPGLGHFFPRGEWLRLAGLADLALERELRITPFVRVFVLRTASDGQAEPRT